MEEAESEVVKIIKENFYNDAERLINEFFKFISDEIMLTWKPVFNTELLFLQKFLTQGNNLVTLNVVP